LTYKTTSVEIIIRKTKIAYLFHSSFKIELIPRKRMCKATEIRLMKAAKIVDHVVCTKMERKITTSRPFKIIW
jgi:hypothetical protein